MEFVLNTDIRLSVDFFNHHKTRRLLRKLGGDGVVSLVKMFCYAGKFRADGVFKGMDAEDIADSVDWTGDADEFVSTLCEVGFLEQCEDGIYSLHDWEEHNPWAAGANARSEAASKAGKASAEKRAKKSNERSTDFNGPFNDRSTERSTDFNGQFNDRSTERSTDFNGASTPSPSPSPSPSPKEIKDIVGQGSPTAPAMVDHQEENPPKPDPVPYAAIVAKLNEVCGCQFKASTQVTRRHIKARWNEGWRLPDFEAVVTAKFAEWGSDAEMCRFLRPETLFGTKFESYLQFAKNGGGTARPLNESTAPANQDELVRKIREQRAERERKAREAIENATA